MVLTGTMSRGPPPHFAGDPPFLEVLEEEAEEEEMGVQPRNLPIPVTGSSSSSRTARFSRSEIDDFHQLIDCTGLLIPPVSGSNFTWQGNANGKVILWRLVLPAATRWLDLLPGGTSTSSPELTWDHVFGKLRSSPEGPETLNFQEVFPGNIFANKAARGGVMR
ncbi:hypothetical protein HPP92_023283 [Vanilla planifolia]|uniref:Uncharacterized protein n=1 Tax=Vanilla planifolia TaxID=51239 RepID=A0A835PX05_VANPL|nr:hypothetical protein HPP92_023283 [Vanilla planifolia]